MCQEGPAVSFDPPEEQRAGTLPEHRDPVRQRRLVVEVGLARAAQVGEKAFGARPHG
jgi:hypothetical protein